MRANHEKLMADIDATGKWDDACESTFKSAIAEFKKAGSW